MSALFWPDVLRPLFPLHPAAHPHLPWWRYDVDAHGAPGWTRVDGRAGTRWVPGILEPADPQERAARTRHSKEGMDPVRVRDALVAIDTKRPRPPPGIRTGQVWIATYADDQFPPEGLDGGAPYRITVIEAPQDWLPLRPVSYNTHGSCLRYLIADPCCPWLAPWIYTAQPASPVKVDADV